MDAYYVSQQRFHDKKKNSIKMRAMGFLVGSALYNLISAVQDSGRLDDDMQCRCGVSPSLPNVPQRKDSLRFEVPMRKCWSEANRYDRFFVRTRLANLPEILNVVTSELSFFNPDTVRPSLFWF